MDSEEQLDKTILEGSLSDFVGPVLFQKADETKREVFRYHLDWDEQKRLAYLSHLLNNNSFLILPWVRVKTWLHISCLRTLSR